MNVLLIYSLQDAQSTEKPLSTPQQIQFGISYISSFLKEKGHNTELLILTRETKNSVIDEYLERFKPELIGFTAVATEFDFVADIARYIKSRRPHIYLLIGGVHVSLNPEDSMLEYFDALCVGEGEEPALELINQLEEGKTPAGIANLWIKRNNKIEKSPTRPFINNIDSLPFPDREMWIKWTETSELCCSVLLGRGCPFQCTYCCNHAVRTVSEGAYVRFRSPENVINELEEISLMFPEMDEVYYEVETFVARIKWAIDICSALESFNSKRERPFTYGVNLRVTPKSQYETLFEGMKKSNFKYINIGLESGSERVRKEILKRNYSNDDIINAVTLARKHGLKVSFFNLIGIPGETVDDFKETVRVNRICLPDRHYLSIFYPYPGTELYFLCKKQGLIDDNINPELERRKSVLDLKGFSRKQIQRSYIWFDYYAFKGYRPLYKILARVFLSQIHSNYYLNRLYNKITCVKGFNLLKRFLRSY